MNALTWLAQKSTTFDLLSNAEKAAISDFVLLWTFFEAHVLDTNANATSILKVTQAWDSKGLLNKDAFDEHLVYFQNRYCQNGQYTERLKHLHLRNSDKPDLVKSVIQNQETNPSKLLAGLLIIVFRFRNNLFHGIKWEYNIEGQYDNFTHASELLILAMELHEHY